MRKKLIGVGLAAAAGLCAAAIVVAQGPPPPFFGRGEGIFVRPVTGEPFQASFTLTRTENDVVGGTTSTVTATTTGTIARDADGDTYSDVHTPGPPSSTSSGGGGGSVDPEIMHITNLSLEKEWIVNVTKQTYEVRTIKPRGDHHPGDHPGPRGGNGSYTPPTPTPLTYTVPDSSYTCSAEEVTTNRTIQPASGQSGVTNPSVTISSDAISCPALHQVLKATHTDTARGSTTLLLTGLVTTPSVSFTFTPPSGYTEVQPRNFGGRGAWRGGPPN